MTIAALVRLRRLPPGPARRGGGASATAAAATGGELVCSRFGACGGCTLETGVLRPPAHARVAAALGALGVPRVAHHAPTGAHGWRRKARLVASSCEDGSVVLGLYARGTHDVVDVAGTCAAHAPSLDRAAKAVEAAATELGVSAFDEGTHSGLLRYVQLVAVGQHDDAPVEMALVVNAEESTPELVALAGALWTAHGGRLVSSVHANYNPTRGNVIVGKHGWERLHGDAEHWEEFGGADVCFSPASFVQANYAAFDALLRRLHPHVPSGSRVAELYAGSGAIGLSIARSCDPARVHCVEVNPAAELPFQKGRARLPEGLRARVSMTVAPAGERPEDHLGDADLVVVDPPRKGLDDALVQALLSPSSRVRRLMYVSCGMKALERDAKRLRAGGLIPTFAETFLFFPGTDHVETLVVFDRDARGVGAEPEAAAPPAAPARFQCPKCEGGLELQADVKPAVLACRSGHTLTLAKEGHAFLLPSHTSKKGRRLGVPAPPTGDAPTMNARRDVADSGRLDVQAAEVARAVAQSLTGAGDAPRNVLLVDCGHGWFLERIAEALGDGVALWATGTSKNGVRMAAKRNKRCRCAVAASQALPFDDASMDVVVSVLAPSVQVEEAFRVLRPGGALVVAAPGPDHLAAVAPGGGSPPAWPRDELEALPPPERRERARSTAALSAEEAASLAPPDAGLGDEGREGRVRVIDLDVATYVRRRST